MTTGKHMKEPHFPITAAHRAQFEKHLRKWRELLNLRDWRVELQQRPDHKHEASVTCQHRHKIAEVKLGTFFLQPTTPRRVESAALHELLHVLLSSLVAYAVSVKDHDEIVDELEHEVVIVLEDLLLEAFGDH